MRSSCQADYVHISPRMRHQHQRAIFGHVAKAAEHAVEWRVSGYTFEWILALQQPPRIDHKQPAAKRIALVIKAIIDVSVLPADHPEVFDVLAARPGKIISRCRFDVQLARSLGIEIERIAIEGSTRVPIVHGLLGQHARRWRCDPRLGSNSA